MTAVNTPACRTAENRRQRQPTTYSAEKDRGQLPAAGAGIESEADRRDPTTAIRTAPHQGTPGMLGCAER